MIILYNSLDKKSRDFVEKYGKDHKIYDWYKGGRESFRQNHGYDFSPSAFPTVIGRDEDEDGNKIWISAVKPEKISKVPEIMEKDKEEKEKFHRIKKDTEMIKILGVDEFMKRRKAGLI